MSKERRAGQTARWIALTVTGCIMLGTLFVVVVPYFRNGKLDDVVLQTILPLWGTWIGTVLAFYFGKTNFEVASEAIGKVTSSEKMAKLLVRNIMVRDIEYLEEEEVKDAKIQDILESPDFKKFQRFPIFNDGVVRYVIHRSLFDEFIRLKVKEGKLTLEELNNLKLEDLLKENSESIQKKLYRGFAIVSMSATLLDAKKEMDNTPECNDVFVTESGNTDEKVCGLITSGMILKEVNV